MAWDVPRASRDGFIGGDVARARCGDEFFVRKRHGQRVRLSYALS